MDDTGHGESDVDFDDLKSDMTLVYLQSSHLNQNGNWNGTSSSCQCDDSITDFEEVHYCAASDDVDVLTGTTMNPTENSTESPLSVNPIML